MLAVLAERHRALAVEPRGELLVGLDEPVGADAQDDGAQAVEDVVRTVRVCSDLRVETNQRLADLVLDKDLVRLPEQILAGEEVPAEPGHRPRSTSETRADGGVVGDAAAQQVPDERLDGVALVEAHDANLTAGAMLCTV